MKHIIKLGVNRYIHLDSYETHGETPLSNLFVGIFCVAIAAMTVGAAMGVDITKYIGAY
jgi:hypothetical protein